MKYFLSLILITTPLLAYQVGESSLGGQLGFATSEFELDYGSVSSVDANGDLTGFSFELTGNLNTYNNSNNTFGLDLYTNFAVAPALSDTINGTEIEASIYNLNSSLRPYFRTGIFSPYAVIGISYSSFEVEEEGFTGWRKGTKFSPTLGFGASLSFTESLVFSPSFTWSKAEVPSISSSSYSIDFGSVNAFNFNFPLTYQVSDHFSIGAVLNHTNYSDVEQASGQLFGSSVTLTDPIKFSYWVTSFMVKGDFVF